VIVSFVIVGVEGSFNLGLIARVCKNFGIDRLYLVDPKADFEEALRYSSKAKDYLMQARIVSSIDEAIREAKIVAATSAEGYSEGDVLRQAVSIDEFMNLVKRVDGEIAVLFGRESTGLTREELKKADILVTIPANPEYPVLNLSHAVAIFAWEFWKVRGLKATNIPPRASREEIDTIISLIASISSEAVSVREKVERMVRVWRNILYRAHPSVYEARVLTYWARRTLNKIRSCKPTSTDR